MNAEQIKTLDAQETAEELRLGINTTYSLLASGAIPGVKVGRQWRVSREALDAFLRGHLGSPET